jgi:hypothetical protein
LRLVSLGVNRAQSINYSPTPNWLKIDKSTLGISPSIENLDISENNIFYLYGDAPAVITTTFQDGTVIDTYVGDDAKVFVTIFDKDGRNIASKRMAKELNIKSINILPQISYSKRRIYYKIYNCTEKCRY